VLATEVALKPRVIANGKASLVRRRRTRPAPIGRTIYRLRGYDLEAVLIEVPSPVRVWT